MPREISEELPLYFKKVSNNKYVNQNFEGTDRNGK